MSRPPRRAGDPDGDERVATAAKDDARIGDPHLRGVRVLARLLDEAVRIPGTNVTIGLDPILGVLPGAGDVVGGALSAYAIVVAGRVGAPPSVLARMVGNVALDAIVGSVPVLGDLFDVGFKANARNLALLERHVAAPEPTARASRGLVLLAALAVLLLIVGMFTLGVLLARVVWTAITG